MHLNACNLVTNRWNDLLDMSRLGLLSLALAAERATRRATVASFKLLAAGKASKADARQVEQAKANQAS